jgi:DNA topoisomerase VI subunit B
VPDLAIAIKRNDKHVLLSFTDKGIGIPAKGIAKGV